MTATSELPRVLSVAATASYGLSRAAVEHRIATRGWQRLARGFVLTAPGEPTRDDWALLGLAAAGPRAAVSGWDAVRTYGLGPPVPPTPRVLIVDRDGRNRVVGGVRIRPTNRPYTAVRLPVEHPTLAAEPVVSLPRALADAALEHPTADPVRAMVTAAVQRRLCRPEDLFAELAAGPRARSRTLRIALEDVVAGAHSVAEADAIRWLRRVPVPAFEANAPILDGGGREVAVADLLWRRLRAIVEIDSREFHFGAEEWKATMRRHNRLTALGWAVAHYPPSEVRDRRAAWAHDVAQWLRRRAAELDVPYLAA